MRCRTLINLVGKYNHYNILAALKLKPKTIVFIRMDNDEEVYENTKTCLRQKLPEARLMEHIIKEETWKEISEVISRYNQEDTFLNLSGGSKLMSLLALQAAQELKLLPIYIDSDKGKIMKFRAAVEELEALDIVLTVEDIVCSTGAEILKHTTEMFDKQKIRDIVSYMIKNYSSWCIVKTILRNSYIVNQSALQPFLVELSTRELSNEQIKAVGGFLQELYAKGLISDYGFYVDFIEFTLSSREAKSFIMTAGCWLEAITYSCIRELREVDNAISGMLFVWDEEVQVQNELDVVASVDSHLVCISCKDTEKYDVEDLNELEVYAEHLGGRRVIKILVSTQKPERGEMIFQRAEEMGINIILFNGDLISFKNELHKLLMK